MHPSITKKVALLRQIVTSLVDPALLAGPSPLQALSTACLPIVGATSASPRPPGRVLLKRDDLLGAPECGGNKLRKLASCLRWLESHPHPGTARPAVAMIGGRRSNSLPATAAVLRQRGFPVLIPYLLEAHSGRTNPCLQDSPPPGQASCGGLRPRVYPLAMSPSMERPDRGISPNELLLELLFDLPTEARMLDLTDLAPGDRPEHHVWRDLAQRGVLSRELEDAWCQPNILAAGHPSGRVLSAPRPVEVLPEGLCFAPSLPGALSLPLEVAEHILAKEIRLPATVYMDAGTGFSAGAFAATMDWLGLPVTTKVVLMAGDPSGLRQQVTLATAGLAQLTAHFPPHSESPALESPANQHQLEILRPPAGRSFGSAPASVLAYISQLARATGIFTDPIYSGKLFMTAEMDISSGHTIGCSTGEGDSLVVHSGGVHALFGYGHRLLRGRDDTSPRHGT
ncbi:hypothetical protein H696_03186 [Fonticula alba]|uniref:Tryptophan synthase beta chain-like PALP domain-containing protein n=1 Tax=Fonticula alba TaxID=691883 RepID=A0A058Z939_FONAL|nr:hypothetical protein H696_03186 [Fonticula alba]KCV70829.1 hypothetical protein H696_03186 [Fonticula alba]|eukprot:XP_009495345.1 hypothetical protein H696_03186 [Fonticula alba]